MIRPKSVFTASIALNVLCALLIAAHFLRSGQVLASGLCMLSPLCFLWRRRASLIALQLFSCGAAFVWLATAKDLVERRMALGQPWTLAAVILGAVALVSVGAGLCLRHRTISARYPEGKD